MIPELFTIENRIVTFLPAQSYIRPNCDFCDKSFSDKSNLNKHVTTVHEEKKTFKCKICDAGFVSEGDLNRLLASVHEGRRVQCNFCSSFTKKKQFKKSYRSCL